MCKIKKKYQNKQHFSLFSLKNASLLLNYTKQYEQQPNYRPSTIVISCNLT